MDFHLTNTQSKEKDIFTPQKAGFVSMYQCGPTLYWNQHIGNLRSVVLADFVVRSLHAHNYKVHFVRNYTDVGHLTGDNLGDADTGIDRMEKAAQREALSPIEIAQKYREQFEIDIAKLNTLPPTDTPLATEYIPQMQSLISSLLKKGFAYNTPLAIYFDISKVNEYTKLSGQSIDNLIDNSGHGTITDSEKKNSQDFVLWFFKAGSHAEALQTWQSPFTSSLAENGEGFPGWHIECSAMAESVLGETLDIHMGGIEHISVHHTNEIAQSEAAHDGTQFVNYWLHNEHLLVDGRKMSKSDGTSYILDDLIAKGFSPLDLRYFFLQAHYRSKQNFTWEAITSSQTALKRLRDTVQRFSSGDEDGFINQTQYTIFLEALADDINTAQALAVVYSIIKSDISDADKKATVEKCDEFLGLELFTTQTKSAEKVIPEAVTTLAEDRFEARKNKDWQLSDELRDKVRKLGYDIIDSVDSYTITAI
jgi:cysteinyl-tRNA synthetase